MKCLRLSVGRLFVAGLLSLGLTRLVAQNPAAAHTATNAPQKTTTPGAPGVNSAGGMPRPVNAARLKFLTEKLGLDTAQQGKIRDILEHDARKMSELTSPAQRTGESVRELNRARNAAIEAVLTPEQREKYKALVTPTPGSRTEKAGVRPANTPVSQ